MKTSLILAALLMTTPAYAASRAWISEFSGTRAEAQAPFAKLPALVHQPPLDLSAGTNKRSATFNASTNYIRVECEVQCAVQSGVDAANSAIVLPANRPEYFGVKGGSILSVIAVP